MLDVGGWAAPLSRADYVIDLLPYDTRGLYGEPDPAHERFDAASWIVRDICEHEPWPFADDQFDFAVCSHTLEDVRDPVWVCSELNRVARAGYIEVPSRLEEQSWGVHGEWVGWTHHRWLVDVGEGDVTFVHKPHMLGARPEFHFPAWFGQALTPEQRVQGLFWEGGFTFSERVYLVPEELDLYLSSFVEANRTPRPRSPRRRRLGVTFRSRSRARRASAP